jgi:hypothetical protein
MALFSLKIALANAEFTRELTAWHQNADAVSATDSDVAEISCEVATLKRYRQNLSHITALLVLYKALLEKDQSAITSVQTNMVEKDKLLQGKFSGLNPLGGGLFGIPR